MKRLATIITLLSLTLASMAQEVRTYEGQYYNDENDIHLVINLYEQSIDVPGLELEKCYGFLRGNTNGCWIILKVKEKDDSHALVRAASEKGSDAQDILLTPNETGMTIEQTDGANIKGIKGRKYVKLPKTIDFIKKK